MGWLQKFGQYFGLQVLSGLRKPRLRLEDEAHIYASSAVSINVHEEYQRRFGGDCNERTFKVPLCGGFEITDDVACIRKYFKAGEEIVVADGERDFLDKVEHYLRHPEERLPIVEKGRERVLREHTYHDRVARLLGAAAGR
jgi:spore maturation protein CgeB